MLSVRSTFISILPSLRLRSQSLSRSTPTARVLKPPNSLAPLDLFFVTNALATPAPRHLDSTATPDQPPTVSTPPRTRWRQLHRSDPYVQSIVANSHEPPDEHKTKARKCKKHTIWSRIATAEFAEELSRIFWMFPSLFATKAAEKSRNSQRMNCSIWKYVEYHQECTAKTRLIALSVRSFAIKQVSSLTIV